MDHKNKKLFFLVNKQTKRLCHDCVENLARVNYKVSEVVVYYSYYQYNDYYDYNYVLRFLLRHSR